MRIKHVQVKKNWMSCAASSGGPMFLTMRVSVSSCPQRLRLAGSFSPKEEARGSLFRLEVMHSLAYCGDTRQICRVRLDEFSRGRETDRQRQGSCRAHSCADYLRSYVVGEHDTVVLPQRQIWVFIRIAVKDNVTIFAEHLSFGC